MPINANLVICSREVKDSTCERGNVQDLLGMSRAPAAALARVLDLLHACWSESDTQVPGPQSIQCRLMSQKETGISGHTLPGFSLVSICHTT